MLLLASCGQPQSGVSRGWDQESGPSGSPVLCQRCARSRPKGFQCSPQRDLALRLQVKASWPGDLGGCALCACSACMGRSWQEQQQHPASSAPLAEPSAAHTRSPALTHKCCLLDFKEKLKIQPFSRRNEVLSLPAKTWRL